MLLTGCSMRQVAVNEMAGLMNDGMAALENDDDLEMLEQAFPANIKLIEALLASAPDHPELLVLLSRLYGSYGFAFLETRLEIDFFGAPETIPRYLRDADIDPAEVRRKASRYYARGEAYAMRALTLRHPNAAEAMKTVDGRDAFFNSMQAEDVPALFWWGFNLGARVNQNRSSVAMLAKAHLAERAMKRVVALAPDYQNGGAHMFLLVYYGARPPMMGGDLEAAEGHYQALNRINGDAYRMGHVMYCRYILTKRQDRAGYLRLLSRVTEEPLPGEYRLYNALAVLRARIYLGAVDDLFDEEETE
jgi:hypothetical protein